MTNSVAIKAASEQIDLMRGGDLVSTLTGAFGQSLRETRLTAVLGYLIALHPKPFLKLFGFEGSPQRVSLETQHQLGRSDILVETTQGTGVIEAKVDATDPFEQSRRYPARWIALLTHRVPRKKTIGRARYVRWQQLAELLEGLSHTGPTNRLRLISEDLLNYMEGHQMTQSRPSIEIYAREINEPLTLALFINGHLYGCKYEAGSRVAEALYFAPHFGQRIAKTHPYVATGISYVARINSVGHATTWSEFRDLAYEHRGRVWWNRHKPLLQDLRQKWSWSKGEQRSMLLLGPPRLVFNPAVRKEVLQEGKGWLSKRFFSFDELFEAWAK